MRIQLTEKHGKNYENGVIYDNQNEILYGKVDRIGGGGFGTVWKFEDAEKRGKENC